MSAKQFGHFLNLQQQLAAMQRPARRSAKTVRPVRANAVAEAKDWLAGAGRSR
jgi:hypothetical protein